VVRHNFQKSGVNFLSKADFPLQLGVSSYKEGERIKPHFHMKKEIVINEIQEVVHLESGKAVVSLYGSNNQKFDSVELQAGDTIFFVAGGHGFTMLDDTKIVEVKQGPYLGKDKDKAILE